jgi:four helix bundle protein
MSGGLKDLKVWQEAVALASDVIRALRHGNRREIKAVAEAIMLTALSLAAHIADGYGRYTAPEQRQVYRAARRDLLRLETQIAIARQAELLSAAHEAQLSQRIQIVARLLGGYLVYLDRQLADAANASRDSARGPD